MLLYILVHMAIVISNRIVIVMVVDSLAALPCGYFSCDHMRSFDFTHKLVLNISVKIAHPFIITCSNQQTFHCCICSLAFSLRHLVLHPGVYIQQDKVNYAVSEREDRVTDVATMKG